MALVGQQLRRTDLPVKDRHSFAAPGQYGPRGQTKNQTHRLASDKVRKSLDKMENGHTVSESAIDSILGILEGDDHEEHDTSHIVYHYAGIVFGSLCPGFKSDFLLVDKNSAVVSSPPKLPVKDEKLKKKVYDLAFSTLKYQALLEDILVDSGYYSYNTIPDENHNPIMVILCSMLHRRFIKRRFKEGDSCIPYIHELEDDLQRLSIKLNASLARSRIKFQARSIELLLPPAVREREERGVELPVYTWVNQLKTSVTEVIEELQNDGYRQMPSVDQLEPHCFTQDDHCPNVFAFPVGSRDELLENELVKHGMMVLQDKITCLGPHSIKSLLNEGDDVIHVNVGSGWTTAHLASLINHESCTVYAFGVTGEEHYEVLSAKMAMLGANNVKLMKDNFLDVQHIDPRLKNVKVVLVTTRDTRSGITNPVEYIINEGEDPSILRELSQENLDEGKIDELVSEHMELMKHAMKFPKVQAVVYATTSILPEENENVVTKVVEYTNHRNHGSQNLYKVIPPTLPLTPKDLETQTSSRFFQVSPSTTTAGCFVAIVSRQDKAMSASDILARAAAKGLYDMPGKDATATDDEGRKPKKKPSKAKQKTIQKMIRTSKSSPSAEVGHGHHADRSPIPSRSKLAAKKTKPVRTAKKTGKSKSGKLKTKNDTWNAISASHLLLMRSTPTPTHLGGPR